MTLPTDTVLDIPGAVPGADHEAIAVLKAIYLEFYGPLFEQGISETEVINEVEALRQRGLLTLVDYGESLRVVPTEQLRREMFGLTPAQEKTKNKNRLRRKLSRRRK